MTMPVWQVQHEMMFVSGGDEYVEWCCSICQRRIRFYDDRRTMKIITPGDPYAAHYGSHGLDNGLDIGIAVEIESNRKGGYAISG